MGKNFRKLASKKSVTMIAACLMMVSVFSEAQAKKATDIYQGKQAKYVFYFIGDGAGMPQRTAAEMYLKSVKGEDATLLMNTFPAQGITTTFANNRFITGSAAAATALASGIKTNINYIGVDKELNSVKNMAEMAKEKGKKVGIISSVSIDHATPACFYAHQPTRKMYHEIDMDLANSSFDFFGGGGMVDPEGKKSKNPLGNALETAKKNGFKLVNDKASFMALNKKSGRVIAVNNHLPDAQALPYQMDNTADDIALDEFTAKAIELLDNKKGFFLMVEGGKIDWACHANDAAAAIKDTLVFDDAITVAYKFYQKHPDETLIVITGDHECGGMSLGFAGTKYDSNFEILKKQKKSFQFFQDVVLADFKKENTGKADFSLIQPIITEYFGLAFEGNDITSLKDYEIRQLENAFLKTMAGAVIKSGSSDFLLYGDYDPLVMEITHLLNNKAGIAWTSYSHTGVPVSTSAIGKGSEIFNGYYDNTDVAIKIMSFLGVKNLALSLN
jgi:alkaline phosphatase